MDLLASLMLAGIKIFRTNSMLHPRLLLLGGGYTLSHLAARLDCRQFVITSRSTTKVLGFSALGYTARELNLHNLRALRALCSEFPSIEVVIDSVPEHPNINDTIAVFKDSNISQVLYLSSTAVFGVRDGSEVSEDSHCSPQYAGAQARLEVENRYRTSAFITTSLRLSGIYGPGRGIGNALKRGSYYLVNGGSRWSNRIQVEDIVQAIIRLIDNPAPPSVLCVSDNEPALAKDVVDFYCTRFALPRPSSLSLDQAISRGMHHQLSNQRVRNDRLQALLGENLRYPTFRQGAETEFM